ncbi:lycopene cyclase family protein [Robiginitalea sp. M39]|uniref:Lycopene cyclase family protein n=2 Tax=Robiginitalea aurantiaca TaxID=3056915 RepID=A0ABT7WAY5_9FLAO|nr:lycopene cyclase family protein [Robiginitalea aurantiaca]
MNLYIYPGAKDSMTEYDYIIIGGGASGLLLADALGSDPYFREKRIAIFEKEPQKGNDRTWCFWEPEAGRFDALLHRKWSVLRFRGPEYDRSIPMQHYTYKMLRGSDFYREYHSRIARYPNVEVRFETVTSLKDTGQVARLSTEKGDYCAPRVFSSVSFLPSEHLMQPYPLLQQHFLGWFIRTKEAIFDPDAATFMDFSIPQKGNTRFMYILPFSPTEALVEYTLFSETLLAKDEYEEALKSYIHSDLGCEEYEILETEQGSIPMTVNKFNKADSAHITHIGIAGGWAKPSTGYTFWNTSQKVPKLVDALKKDKSLKMSQNSKFWYYDRLLLDVLTRENAEGSKVFLSLFRNLNPEIILKFLNEETNLAEDFRIINNSPKAMFIRAFLKALLRSSY